jgi:23S rRNA (cytosine1962-C5)-methyltransferase
VDASKPAISWAIENQRLSGLTEKPIRWIVDDALKFVKREERRGNKYDGIIMDPPKFGRGPKGEVWQFEKDLPELLEYTAKIVTSTPLFFIITAYTVPVSSITIANMIQDLSLKNGMIEHGELVIEENSGRQLTTAIYSRWGVSL